MSRSLRNQAMSLLVVGLLGVATFGAVLKAPAGLGGVRSPAAQDRTSTRTSVGSGTAVSTMSATIMRASSVDPTRIPLPNSKMNGSADAASAQSAAMGSEVRMGLAATEFPSLSQEHTSTAIARATESVGLGSERFSPLASGTAQFAYETIGFPGIQNTGWFPPDVQVAAGPGYVVEMVNLNGEIWTTGGSVVSTFTLASFFGRGSDRLSDPKVLYDTQSSRWFASIMDITTSSVTVAVSAGTNPAGTWTPYTVSVGYCPDQPILGVNDDKVAVSFNDFTSGSCASFDGAEYLILNKTNMLSASSAWYSPYGPDSSLASVHPVQSLSSTSTLYMVSSEYNVMDVFSIDGAPPNAIITTEDNLGISPLSSPPDAPQAGTSSLIATNDNRVLDAAWQSGTLWISLNDGCVPQGDSQTRACFRLTEIDTGTMTVLEDFDYGSAGMYYFYPALRMDQYGDLAITFGYSSPSTYPGLAVVWRTYDDPAGYLQSPSGLYAGSGPETGYCTSGVCRYGDYFGAAVDATNPSLVWLAGEYGTASGWGTYIAQVRDEVAETLNYSVTGGGSGYSAPSLEYQYAGTYYVATLSTSPTTFYVDAGSDWYFPSLLSGSSSTEQWQSLYGYGYADHSAESITLPYYHQFLVSFSYLVVGGGAVAPSIAYVQLGSSWTATGNSTVWADAGSVWQYTNPVNGGTSGERWMSADGAGLVSSAASVVVAYQHQFALTASYSVVGGGSPSAPTLAGTYLSTPFTATLTTAATQFWLDSGTMYTTTNPLVGSTNSERWQSTGATSGAVTASATTSIVYYHQYLMTFDYVIVGGGTGYSAPVVSYHRFGTLASLPANASDWADAGSSYAYPGLLGGSTDSQRWSNASSTSGVITASFVVTEDYYHQFYVTFQFAVVGGGSGYSAPTISYAQFGAASSSRANASAWIDAGSGYAFPNTLGGSTPYERWQNLTPAGGTIVSSSTVLVTYEHEYSVKIRSNSPDAGNTTPESGWYAAGQPVTLNAVAHLGWQFERWTASGSGSYSGTQARYVITLTGPINETAEFFAGLTIESTGAGTVSYGYGNVSGVVPAGSSTTIYVAQGTRVSLAAVPSSLNEFVGWNGSATESTITLVVGSPTIVQAVFEPNAGLVATVVALPFIAVICVLLFLVFRKKRQIRESTPVTLPPPPPPP